jgi:hypothetical protein
MTAPEVQSDERENALKPCPFCGGPAEMEQGGRGGPHPYVVRCNGYSCFATPTVTGPTPELAAEAWNTRAAPKENEQ